MITDANQGVLGLDNQEAQHVPEFNIDILIQDCINIGLDQFLGSANGEKIATKLIDIINQEYKRLTDNLRNIIQNKVSQEEAPYINQHDNQVAQKLVELNAQLAQEVQNKKQAIEQSLRSMTFYDQASADSTVALKQAEFEAFQKSRSEQIQSTFSSYKTSVGQNYQNIINALTNTAQQACNQKSEELLSLLRSKRSVLIDELSKLQEEGNNIEVNAIESYNRMWLNSLHSSINALAWNTIDQIAHNTISCDVRTFQQFIEASGRKEAILHKSQIKELDNEFEIHHYALPTDSLEKLFNIIDDPRCIHAHENILKLIFKSAVNGTKLSLTIFKKLENLLDHKEHNQLAVITLLKSVENKQPLPDTTLNKLSDIAGNKNYSASIWNTVNLTIANSLAYSIELSDNIITSLIHNNFVLKNIP